MFVFDLGKIWERTLKEDRNKQLVREKLADVPAMAGQANWLMLDTSETQESEIVSPIYTDAPTPAPIISGLNNWQIFSTNQATSNEVIANPSAQTSNVNNKAS